MDGLLPWWEEANLTGALLPREATRVAMRLALVIGAAKKEHLALDFDFGTRELFVEGIQPTVLPAAQRHVVRC